MNRRSFLAAVAGIPMLGQFAPLRTLVEVESYEHTEWNGDVFADVFARWSDGHTKHWIAETPTTDDFIFFHVSRGRHVEPWQIINRLVPVHPDHLNAVARELLEARKFLCRSR